MPWVGGRAPGSAATPAAPPVSSTPAPPAPSPAPPAPLISLAGKGTTAAMFANTVNTMADPFQQVLAPGKNVLQRASSAVNGVLGVMQAPAQLVNTGLAALTAPLAAAMPALPAATLPALGV
jgi:hypothetical protein